MAFSEYMNGVKVLHLPVLLSLLFFILCLYMIFFLSPPAEADHRGPTELQRGEVPPLPGGASGEHNKWRRPHGRLLLHA